MDVQVKTLTGQTTSVHISEEDTVKDFKSRIALTSISYPSHLQELYFNGEVLNNSSVLKDCNVTDGAQVDVRMKVELGRDTSKPASTTTNSETHESTSGSSWCCFC